MGSGKKTIITIDCPCCKAKMKIDVKNETIVKYEKFSKKHKDLDELLDEQKNKDKRLDDQFNKIFSFEQNKTESIEQQFKDAMSGINKDDIDDFRP